MVLRNTNEIKKSVARYLHRSLIFPIEIFVECRFRSAFEFVHFFPNVSFLFLLFCFSVSILQAEVSRFVNTMTAIHMNMWKCNKIRSEYVIHILHSTHVKNKLSHTQWNNFFFSFWLLRDLCDVIQYSRYMYL